MDEDWRVVIGLVALMEMKLVLTLLRADIVKKLCYKRRSGLRRLTGGVSNFVSPGFSRRVDRNNGDEE